MNQSPKTKQTDINSVMIYYWGNSEKGEYSLVVFNSNNDLKYSYLTESL